MAIREKIKEIVENIDKFKLNDRARLRLEGDLVLGYEQISLIFLSHGYVSLRIDYHRIDLSTEEQAYLACKFREKFTIPKTKSETDNDLLNSIYFNK